MRQLYSLVRQLYCRTCRGWQYNCHPNHVFGPPSPVPRPPPPVPRPPSSPQLNLTRPAPTPTIQPMYILTRYVVWEVLKFFVAALVALTLIVTPVLGMKEGLSRGFPITIMLLVMPCMLPEMLEIAIPVALLFSVCSVFGRMTGANEVVALKSLGISPTVVVWPAIVLATLLSLGTVWMYEIAATWGKPGLLRIGAESIEEIAYSTLQKNRSFPNGIEDSPLSIIVDHVDNRKLIRPRITIKGQPGQPKATLSAREAELQTDWKDHVLTIICYDTTVDIAGQLSYWRPGEFRYTKPIDVPPPPRYDRFWVAMRDIPDRIAELQSMIVERQTTLRGIEKLCEVNRAMGMPESPEDVAKIDVKIDEIDHFQLRIRQLKAEPYRRWANGFTCLCFALIGMPVAMLLRHADVLTNFFVCFLPILAIYYPLLMFSGDLSTSGTWWPISFWMANVVLVVPAMGLLRWIVRH